VCIVQAFLPARHQVLSLCVRPWVRWTARGVGILAGDRINIMFRKGANPAAAIGTGAASYMAPTVAPGRSRLQLLDAVGRLTHSRWPGTHPPVKEGRSTSPSRAPEGDVFLSMSKRTSLNIRA
jgi:hypothetical protein